MDYELFAVDISKDLVVLQYHHIDYLDLTLDPHKIYGKKQKVDEAIAAVKDIFLKNGWEGDGNIGLIWIPPFLDQSNDDYYGSFVWHVKQNNNGTSFLGFYAPIQSAKLLDQNSVFKQDGRDVKPISLIYTEEKNLLLQLKKKKKLLQEVIEHIKSGILSDQLINLTLGYIQNDAISEFNDFIDECYLHYLVHVLSHNNPDSINLKSMSARIGLDQISGKMNDGAGDHWLTIHQIIGDIWKDFKFLPFKDKFKEIMNCIDFKHDPARIADINKHIVIRNCIQHHRWELVDDVLKTIGLDKIRILNDKGKYLTIEKWKLIVLTPEEVNYIIDTLADFCIEYAMYVKERIKSRSFLHNFKEDDYDV